MNAAPAFKIPKIEATILLLRFKMNMTLSSISIPFLIKAFAIRFAFSFKSL